MNLSAIPNVVDWDLYTALLTNLGDQTSDFKSGIGNGQYHK